MTTTASKPSSRGARDRTKRGGAARPGGAGLGSGDTARPRHGRDAALLAQHADGVPLWAARANPAPPSGAELFKAPWVSLGEMGASLDTRHLSRVQ